MDTTPLPLLRPTLYAGGVGVDALAQARLVTIARSSNKPVVLRLAVLGGGCSGYQYEMTLGEPEPEDAVVRFGPEGCAGVSVDPISAPLLVGSTLSFEDTLAAQRFHVTNPNAVAGCGCGVSFAL